MRLLSGGLFRLNSETTLPYNDLDESVTGDSRFVQSTGLQMIHVIFYRFHNLIAMFLSAHYPHWTDDVLFFEARRIVIACYQHIVYYEWLPLVLGMQFLTVIFFLLHFRKIRL